MPIIPTAFTVSPIKIPLIFSAAIPAIKTTSPEIIAIMEPIIPNTQRKIIYPFTLVS